MLVVALRISSLLLAAAAEERALLSQREVSSGTLSCAGDFNQVKKGDICVSTWRRLTTGKHQLRATEPWIGRANVARQLDGHFLTSKKADKWFGKHTLPVVIGDQHLYLTDNHHHSFAINLNPEIHDLNISLEVIDDFRGLGSDFWPQMRASHYSLMWRGSATDPFAMPEEIDPAEMPEDWDLAHYPDSIWRSLAAFANNNDRPESERCFVQTCDYYVDFQWAYVMQVATIQNRSLWAPMLGDVSTPYSLLSKLDMLPVNSNVKDIDLEFWKDLGRSVLPLCRRTSIKNFKLPTVFELPKLIGWSTLPVPEDPDCKPLTRSFSLV
jgi:hypothetical protein